MRFVGVDLSWGEKRPSGLIHLVFDGRRVRIQEWALLGALSEIEIWILDRCRYFGMVAVDAPLILSEDGPVLRPADHQLNQDFRRFGVQTLPISLETYRAAYRLVQFLDDLGYHPSPRIERRKITRALIEVFPTASLVAWNEGKKIVYKRQPKEVVMEGLQRMQNFVRDVLTELEPPLRTDQKMMYLITRSFADMSAQELQMWGDIFDALLCAYTGVFYWYWGEERCRVYGNEESGFIVTPRPPTE